MSGMSATVVMRGVMCAPSVGRRSGTPARQLGFAPASRREISSVILSASKGDDEARGFVNIKGEEGVDEARTEVPQSIKDQYRLIEDPTWLENELLKQDDGYPTSRAAVLKQTLMTGDVKGFGYAVSSVQLTLVMFACAYVAGAASRVSGVEEGDLIYLVGGTFWPFALLGAVSFYLECVKYLEAVVGTSSRRNM